MPDQDSWYSMQSPYQKTQTDWEKTGGTGDGTTESTDYTTEEAINRRLAGQDYSAYLLGTGGGTPNYYPNDPGWVARGGLVGGQNIAAMDARRQALANVAAYEAQIRRGESAAQQQLLGGIRAQRAGMMGQAGMLGANPAMQRSAAYAGGQLQQRGATQQEALKAQELAYAQDLRQQALAALQQQAMQTAQGNLTTYGIQTGMTGLQSQLAAQKIQQEGAANKAALSAGIGAAGTGIAVLGGMFGGESGGGNEQKTFQPDYSSQDWQDVYQNYSDVRLKTGVQQPAAGQERQLLAALTAEDRAGLTADELAAYDAAQQQLAANIAQRNQAEQQALREEQTKLLGALIGSGKQYQYNDLARQQLGQPAGMQYGPMAQDLEKTKLGAGAVIDTPQGKMVDTGRVAMMSAGLIGRQQEQIDEQQRKIAALEKRTR